MRTSTLLLVQSHSVTINIPCLTAPEQTLSPLQFRQEPIFLRNDEDVPQVIAVMIEDFIRVAAGRDFPASFQRTADHFCDSRFFKFCQHDISIGKEMRP